MYDTILLALDTSPADRPIIDHVKKLARSCTAASCCSTSPRAPRPSITNEDAGGEEVGEARDYLQHSAGRVRS